MIKYHASVDSSQAKTQGGPASLLLQQRRIIPPKKTVVYDDQADYFTMADPWLSESDKKIQREKEKKRREEEDEEKKRITIDFAGRKVYGSSTSPPVSVSAAQEPVPSNAPDVSLGDSNTTRRNRERAFVPETSSKDRNRERCVVSHRIQHTWLIGEDTEVLN
jgi:hypothetical protein